MKIKKLLRKINRGLVLFVLILAIFITTVVVQATKFKKEKPDISESCKTFCNSFCEMLITPESCRGESKELTDAQNQAAVEKVDKFMENWTEMKPIDSLSYYSVDTKYRADALASLKNTYKSDGYISKAICKISDKVSIRQVSSDTAYAQFSCDYTIDHMNSVEILCDNNTRQTFGGYGQMSFYEVDDGTYYDNTGNHYTKEERDAILATQEDSSSRTYITIQYEMYMKKTDSGWKAADIASYSYDTSTVAN